MSVLIGHASARTAEKYCGRQKNIMAMEKACATWDTSLGQTSSQDSIPGTEGE